ncbi:MAG: hypothetical protein K8R08_01690 [Methanosarcinales archaeon]|nr:hypothetical protein [Methanosarcinales archaeon]
MQCGICVLICLKNLLERGTDKQEAAEYIREHVTKPVVGYVVGISAPPGKTMGHAGAIISGGGGTAKEKIEALEGPGVVVAGIILWVNDILNVFHM